MVTIAVRERHYPRDHIVLRVPRLRVLARLRLLSVRSLLVITIHVFSLFQTSLQLLRSPNESLLAVLSIASPELPSYTTNRKVA